MAVSESLVNIYHKRLVGPFYPFYSTLITPKK